MAFFRPNCASMQPKKSVVANDMFIRFISGQYSNELPNVLLRVTISYFAKVDASALDAELYSQIDITAVVRWGGKTLTKIPRGGPLAEYYPIKSFEVKFARPREGDPVDRGQPTVEVLLKDRVLDADNLKRRYALLISLVSPTGDILLNDLVQELERSRPNEVLNSSSRRGCLCPTDGDRGGVLTNAD